VPTGPLGPGPAGSHSPFGTVSTAAALRTLGSVRMWGNSRLAASAVAAIALVGAPWVGPFATLPAAGAVIGVLVVLADPVHHRQRVAAVTTAVAAVSLAATAGAVAWADYTESDRTAGTCALVEVGALLVLVLMTARHAPVRSAIAAGTTACAAAAVWLLRFLSAQPLPQLLTALLVGVLVTAGAAAVGAYLRALDNARRRSVLAARRAQRLQLARDLHDFVAHEVSAMLAQAQAGQILAAQAPERTGEVFQRIEQAGLAALASMDRTVQMLHDADDPVSAAPDRTPLPGLDALPDLVERFAASSGTRIELDVDPTVVAAGRHDVTATAYRVVVEALTNVRRHAHASDRVDVTVGRSGARLEVTVTNEGSAPPVHDPSRRGGHGLRGLAEQVELLGGTFTAGGAGARGWRVFAALPLNPARPA
jgi:signal transduction histidine kinase